MRNKPNDFYASHQFKTADHVYTYICIKKIEVYGAFLTAILFTLETFYQTAKVHPMGARQAYIVV